jgi:hypothetical protein
VATGDSGYSKRNKELAKVAAQQARDELVREQDDVFALADRNREIVELPPGLENGLTMKRKRGARTDTDCINEVCEIVAQGITATAIFIDKCELADAALLIIRPFAVRLYLRLYGKFEEF